MLISKDKVVLLIPSLDPDEKLIGLLKELTDFGFSKILIVNDGSKEENRCFFEKAEREYKCDIFTHYKNYGKGRALKNAFNYLLTNYKDFDYVVTLDSDGQHKPKDVLKVVEKLIESEKKDLVMGCRTFNNDKKIPFRSKFGNILTRNVLKALCGIKCSDTQTGLRGFSRELLYEFLDTPGERFEYEMNMLIETKNKNVKIVECPIETVYLEENKSSHFNPLLDSYRIYSLFFKFIWVSLASFVVDILLFSIFVVIFDNITVSYYVYIATVLARVISSIFNFLLNKKKVFKKSGNLLKQAVGYFSLALVIMCLSAIGTNLFVKKFLWNEILSKLLVDGLLFILSFVVQRDFIFKNKKEENEK